jgi:hypothetical protein
MIRYYGEQNVPGAPGQALIAGSPGSRLSEDEMSKRLYEHYMQNNPTGQQIRQRGQQFQQNFNRFPMQAGMQPMGNAGAFIDNAQMFMGPQLGQVPAGFQNKIVS